MKIVNNKKYLPLLIAAVIALWAMIGYRIYDQVAHDVEIEPIKIATKAQLIEAEEAIWSPTFDFRDPFLKNQTLAKNTIKKEVLSGKKNLEKKPPPVISQKLPVEVSYQGFVMKATTKKKMAIVEIGDVVHFLMEGEVKENISLTKVFTDSIMVSYNGANFVIKLKP
ncbi:MAG: hypothetical protein ABJF04_23125 [Reichenbachiella sp.]|uniref:hypothetical protein n=1 Tax=Reichenbachiella sp. TaxID=2184521 RepID=UPI003263B9C8